MTSNAYEVVDRDVDVLGKEAFQRLAPVVFKLGYRFFAG